MYQVFLFQVGNSGSPGGVEFLHTLGRMMESKPLFGGDVQLIVDILNKSHKISYKINFPYKMMLKVGPTN